MLSATALVRLLVDVVAGGGNLLLGVGPAADGTIPPAQLSRLQGTWPLAEAQRGGDIRLPAMGGSGGRRPRMTYRSAIPAGE